MLAGLPACGYQGSPCRSSCLPGRFASGCGEPSPVTVAGAAELGGVVPPEHSLFTCRCRHQQITHATAPAMMSSEPCRPGIIKRTKRRLSKFRKVPSCEPPIAKWTTARSWVNISPRHCKESSFGQWLCSTHPKFSHVSDAAVRDIIRATGLRNIRRNLMRISKRLLCSCWIRSPMTLVLNVRSL